MRIMRISTKGVEAKSGRRRQKGGNDHDERGKTKAELNH